MLEGAGVAYLVLPSDMGSVRAITVHTHAQSLTHTLTLARTHTRMWEYIYAHTYTMWWQLEAVHAPWLGMWMCQNLWQVEILHT